MGKAAPFSAKKIKDKPLEDKYCNAFNLKMILGLDDVFFFEQVLKEQRPTALASPDLTMSFNSRSAYLIGRYIKYSRHLPQTPWVLNGEAPFGTSIQEEVQRHILGRFYRPGDEPRLKFHSGGREDIDVRMLGEGRPFVL
jgi:tRNA pseudouridine synthase 10